MQKNLLKQVKAVTSYHMHGPSSRINKNIIQYKWIFDSEPNYANKK